MKIIYTLIFICVSLFANADYWTQKANFPGAGRQLACGFAIGNKGYVSCGNDILNYFNDLWEYNTSTNTWTQKANLPASGRYGAVGFSINNKGYIGTGQNYTIGISFVDFWEYDPNTNIWIQKANFAGVARGFASGFSIGNKGYIGCGAPGSTPILNDFWEWDQGTNVWTQKTSCPIGRLQGAGFSTNGKGYISTGAGSTGWLNDLWEFDPALNSWTQKTALPALARIDATGFAICGKGYLGTGGDGILLNDFWQFDPVTNQWIQKANVPGAPRDDCPSFSIGSKGYLGLGDIGSFVTDFWEYTPDSACATGIEELPNNNLQFTISPNPANEVIVISSELGDNKKIEITITDVNGKKVYHNRLDTRYLILDTKIDIHAFSSGIYFVTVGDGKNKVVKRFIKN